MYCGKCGAQNPDTSAFCSQCGAPLRTAAYADQAATGSGAPCGCAPAAASDAGVAGQAPASSAKAEKKRAAKEKAARKKAAREEAAKEKAARKAAEKEKGEEKHSKRKPILISCVAILAIAVIVLVIVLCSGRGAEATAKKFIKAAVTDDGKDVEDFIPKRLIRLYAQREGISRDDAEDRLEDYFDVDLDDAKVSTKALYEVAYDQARRGEVIDTYFMDGIRVKDAKDVAVRLSIRHRGWRAEGTVPVPVIKVGRSWYVDIRNLDECDASLVRILAHLRP